MGKIIFNNIEYTGGSNQYSAMPTAAASLNGVIVQYIGDTDATYTKGYFYKCQEVTPATDPKTFEWVQLDVQPADGGGAGGGDATVYRYPDGTIYAIRNLDPTTGEYDGGNEVSFSKTEDGVAVSASRDFTEDFSEELVNKAFVDAGLDTKANKSEIPFVATYETTTYEDVKAAIDANRAIVINFPNNNNLICVTFATYTTGQNIVMSGIYKFGNDVFATGVTLTPANAWSTSNSGLYDKTETDAIVSRLNDEIGNKADKADTYTKTEVDALIPDVSDFATQQDLTDGLALKADAATTYTKTETDALLSDKADVTDLADYYTKTEADALLDEKADKSTTYTKTETDALLDEKAGKSSVPEVTVDIPMTGNASSFVGNTGQDGTKNGIEINETAQTLRFIFHRYNSAGRVVDVPNQFALMSKANVGDLVATDNKIGNLGNLQTTDKTNLVAAVNEVNGKAGVHFEVDAEKWYGTYKDENGVTYQVYTKTIYIPALAGAAGATTYPHGISGIKQILSAYGFTTDGFVLNAPRQTAADNISIYQVQKAGGIVIEVGKDRSSKKAYVTLVYAKNN